MRDISALLDDAEKNLLRSDYDNVEMVLGELKKSDPSYYLDSNGHQAENCHLVDYFIAQAIMRRQSDSGIMSKDGIEKAISLLHNSLSFDSNFCDTHLLLGFAYMAASKLNPDRKIEFDADALICFDRAKTLNPNYENESMMNIDSIKMKYGMTDFGVG